MKRSTIILIVILVILGLLIYWLKDKNIYQRDLAPVKMTNQTVSDGVLQFGFPEDFGLAVTKEQVLVKSYIPPCNEGFNYCIYYNGQAFAGTNFESAGIRISKRADLRDETSCLTTPPDGYTNMKPSTSKQASYSASIFSPIGDAGAGHYANGEEYRLWVQNICYEIETRIGETQFANYPPGTIKQFTEDDRNAVYKSFNSIISSLKILPAGLSVTLPVSQN